MNEQIGVMYFFLLFRVLSSDGQVELTRKGKKGKEINEKKNTHDMLVGPLGITTFKGDSFITHLPKIFFIGHCEPSDPRH